MAYAHCHNCGWQQDDWWSENYTPLDYDNLKRLNELLMKAVENPGARMISPMDQPFMEEYFETKHEVDVREYVAWLLTNMAESIRNMYWLTEVEYRADLRCPNCGSMNHMDVD